MSSPSVFAFLATVFLIGAAAGGLPLPIRSVLLLVAGCLVVGFVLARRWVVLLGICIVFFAGWMRATLDVQTIQIARGAVQPFAVVEGIVDQLPDRRLDEQLLTILPDPDSASHAAPVRLQIRAPAAFRVLYGDRIRAEGRLFDPTVGAKDGGSYAGYLASSGIGLIMSRARIEVAGHDPPSRVLEVLFSFRTAFEDRLAKLIPEPAGSFAAGLLTGARGGMPDDIAADFRTSGLTHVVALSGSNVALLASLLFGLLAGPLPRRVALGMALISITAFAFLTGLSASLVRASIMGSVMLLVWHIGRPVSSLSALNLLLVSGVLMTLWHPLALLWDPGFQLSFCAMAGVLFLAPYVERPLRWLPTFFSVRESVTLSVATQLSTMPVSLWKFGRVSWVAPFTNVVVLPLLPPAMLTALLSLLLSCLSEPAARVLAMIPTALLMFAIRVARLGAVLSSAF